MRPHIFLSTISLLLVTVSIAADTSTLKPSLIRTEIRVAKSLNPEDTQEINVRSNNGGFAKIVVKKRDSKTASLVPRTSAVYNTQPTFEGTYRASHLEPVQNSVPNWTPFQQSSLVNQYEPQPTAYVSSSYRFDSPKSDSDNELINSFMSHIGQLEKATSRDSAAREYVKLYKPNVYNSIRNTESAGTKRHDLITLSRSQQNFLVPKPVFISSAPVQFSASEENAKPKRGRSLMKIGGDGIPIVEGIRMPDDEQDKTKTWRNGRVINGELVPYEAGYVPKKAVPLMGDYGQLLFVKEDVEDKQLGRSFGPFMKSDNFKVVRSTGPFTVDDNRSVAARSHSTFDGRRSGPIGPFTVKDNSRMANSKLIDYIKTINDEETRRRDLFESRNSNTFNREDFLAENDSQQPKMQRRMLENAGDLVFAPAKYYSKDGEGKKALEGSRSPVLEYAHPDFGIQAATNTYTPTTSKPVKVQYYAPSNPRDTTPLTLQKHEYYPHSADKYMSTGYPSAYQSKYTYDRSPYGIRHVKQQPFYMRIAEQMREGVQNGFAVVIKPIMEAGQKITKNLGLGRSMDGSNDGQSLFVIMENEDGKHPEKFAEDISAGENKVRVKRNDLYGIGAPQLYKNDKHDHETEFIEVIDVNEANGYGEKSVNGETGADSNAVKEADGTDETATHDRRRRSLVRGDNDLENLEDALLQDVESDSMQQSQRLGDNIRALIQNTDWTNTQCAKKVFCEVMLQQSSDDMTLMEKKMRKFLPM